MSKKDPHINETLEKLEELARGYKTALECANEIISMKNRYIELCEQETELHRRENIRLQKIILWLTVCLGICAVVSLSRLFI
jgi:hypothetical protein